MTKHYETLVGFGLAIFWLIALGGPIGAQTAPPLTVTSSVASCTATVRQSWAPTPQTGWGVQFTWQAVGGAVLNFGNRDVTSPYVQTRTFQPGTYTLGGTWTRTGSPAVVITPNSYTCGTSTTQPPPPPPPPPPAEVCGDGIDNDQDGLIDEGCTVTPPPSEPIWGVVDPEIIGPDFTAAEHDVWTVPGGDGFRYRVWHPQCPVIQNGVLRCYAHEHGDDPGTAGDAWVKSQWDGRFGYAARRYKHHPGEPDGHLEAHEGYKVFVANKGDTNDEGRVNRTWTLASVHFGTFRPGRFITQHHSGSLASRHDWPGDPEMRLKFHLLLDTGGTDVVCDPRATGATKDVMSLQSRCLLNSPYEIWGMTQTIREAGATQEVARVFQVPASFRPVTVLNPAVPSEVVYADDPRVAAIKRFPGDNWSGFKDDVRETYAQNPYLYTGNRTTDIYYTDPLGLVVPASDPNAIQQYVQRGINRISLASTQDNLQFKMKVDYGRGCEPDRDGNCTRPRAGLSGTVSYAKLGVKN